VLALYNARDAQPLEEDVDHRSALEARKGAERVIGIDRLVGRYRLTRKRGKAKADLVGGRESIPEMRPGLAGLEIDDRATGHAATGSKLVLGETSCLAVLADEAAEFFRSSDHAALPSEAISTMRRILHIRAPLNCMCIIFLITAPFWHLCRLLLTTGERMEWLKLTVADVAAFKRRRF
jgi:hypothetical protein